MKYILFKYRLNIDERVSVNNVEGLHDNNWMKVKFHAVLFINELIT